MTKLRWLLMAAVVLVLALAAGCGDDDEDTGGGGGGDAAEEQPARTFEEGTTMARLQEAGTIKIGVKFDVPPFGFKNPQNDQVEGFDIDLGKRIADELGVEPEFIEAVSDNRIPFLQDGTADLILSTMTITGERDQEIDFSEPYYVARAGSSSRRTPTSRGWTTSRASGSARRSGRRTRTRSRRTRRRPTCGSSTRTRSASSSCRTARSTPSPPTT